MVGRIVFTGESLPHNLDGVALGFECFGKLGRVLGLVEIDARHEFSLMPSSVVAPSGESGVT